MTDENIAPIPDPTNYPDIHTYFVSPTNSPVLTPTRRARCRCTSTDDLKMRSFIPKACFDRGSFLGPWVHAASSLAASMKSPGSLETRVPVPMGVSSGQPPGWSFHACNSSSSEAVCPKRRHQTWSWEYPRPRRPGPSGSAGTGISSWTAKSAK